MSAGEKQAPVKFEPDHARHEKNSMETLDMRNVETSVRAVTLKHSVSLTHL